MPFRHSVHLGSLTRTLPALSLCAVLGVTPECTPPASAQSLVEMYQTARFRAQARTVLSRYGVRATPLPVDHVPYATDSVRRHMAAVFPPPEPELEADELPGIVVSKWSLTPKLASSWFERMFSETRWSYLGSNDLVASDTTFTRDLRARLEDRFGAPTRTIAEQGEQEGSYEEYIQFQYWFVVNDTLPMKVMDVNGPFERGVVIATDRTYRDLLPDLKRALMEPVMVAGRAPYVDYYFLNEQQMWFLTGYDGENFFMERIDPPMLDRGRPLLPTWRDP